MKKILTLLLAIAIAGGCFCVDASAASVSPRLAIDSVPGIESGRTVSGHVWFEEGSGDFSQYAVTMALAVTKGGKIWAPKPTSATPSVPLNSDGSFECLFVSGGYDFSAEELYVCLIPKNFDPGSDYDRTEANALDTVMIYRNTDGTIRISQKSVPAKDRSTDNTQTVRPQTESAPGESFAMQKQPKETPRLSLCFSPYSNGLNPNTNSPVPMEHMEWLFNLIHPYADTVRLFGTSGELEKAYKLAKEIYGFRVIGGCWIDARYTEKQIYAELDGLIKLAGDGYIDIAVVGSETGYRNDFSTDRLVQYINYVKNGIRDKSIPVTTSDTAAAFLENQKLVDACDVILMTCYPFFDDTPIDKAPQRLFDTYARVKAKAGSKQVIISETGWPDAGSPEGLSAPGMTNCQKYFETVYNWSRQENVEVVFFEQVDELWKNTEGSCGDVGRHWGHFYASGILKEAYQPVYNSISSRPVTDTESARWAEKEILALVSKGVISPDGPSLYNPKLPIKRGEFMHYLVNTLFPDENGKVATTFSDISPNMYYYYSIGIGQEEGLISGIGNNLSGAERYISREDLFVLIYRAMKYAGMDVSSDLDVLSKYKDKSSISGYAKEAFSALVKVGIVTGDTEGNLNPEAAASRAEAAMLLYRIYILS